MYPRNAASPERIAVGAVVLIADGTVQTSGVSITVVPQGGSTAAGGGTTSYEQGVVFYLPTQAETNYTSFIVTAYKASCIPVSATVVTTASATAGKVVLSGETHTSAVIPTVTTVGTLTTYTGNTPQTGDSYARIGAPAGASLSADIAALPTNASVNAQVVDALNTDTYAEPAQGTPGATITLAAKINYLYKAWRNRSTQTATTYSLYNDNATTVDHKATVSDDATTADKGEVVTGP